MLFTSYFTLYLIDILICTCLIFCLSTDITEQMLMSNPWPQQAPQPLDSQPPLSVPAPHLPPAAPHVDTQSRRPVPPAALHETRDAQGRRSALSAVSHSSLDSVLHVLPSPVIPPGNLPSQRISLHAHLRPASRTRLPPTMTMVPAIQSVLKWINLAPRDVRIIDEAASRLRDPGVSHLEEHFFILKEKKFR